MQRLAPRSYITGSGLMLEECGQKLDLASEQRRLEASGYRNVPQVAEPGDFAVRGALIDIFPMGSAEPYRIELFDDEDRIDPQLRSGNAALAATGGARELLPAREFPLTENRRRTFRNTCASVSPSIRAAVRSIRT